MPETKEKHPLLTYTEVLVKKLGLDPTHYTNPIFIALVSAWERGVREGKDLAAAEIESYINSYIKNS